MGVSIICYENLLESGTVTASSEDTNNEKENAYDNNTFDSWKPTSVPAWIKVDMGTATPVDYWAVYSNDISDVSGTIEFQYSDNDTDWTTIGSSVTPSNNRPIIKIFSQVSHRYYRLYMTGAITNIPVLYFGTYLALPRGMPIGFTVPSMTKDTKLINNMSEGGNYLGNSSISTGFAGHILLENCPASWFRTNWDALLDHIETKMFFFQWNNAKYPTESVLAWCNRRLPEPTYSQRGCQNANIRIMGLNR